MRCACFLAYLVGSHSTQLLDSPTMLPQTTERTRTSEVGLARPAPRSTSTAPPLLARKGIARTASAMVMAKNATRMREK